MKKTIFVLFFGFIGCILFAQATDEQIRQAATTLGVPFEALKQFVNSYRPQNVPSGTISIDSVTLSREYTENVMRADNQYKGKILSVTGSIASIRQNYSGEYYIELIGTGVSRRITIFLNASELHKIASLSNNQRVTIIGTCDGLSGIDVRMINSIIQE